MDLSGIVVEPLRNRETGNNRDKKQELKILLARYKQFITENCEHHSESRGVSRAFSQTELKVRKLEGRDITNTLRKNFSQYIEDIEKVTGRKISNAQVNILRDFVLSNSFKLLDVNTIKLQRAEFNNKRQQIRAEWEAKTGNVWPVYEKDVYSEAHKLLRRKGQSYDAHHIVELCFGGRHEWWNMVPASMPDEHHLGIHRDDGIASNIFGPLGTQIKNKLK